MAEPRGFEQEGSPFRGLGCLLGGGVLTLYGLTRARRGAVPLTGGTVSVPGVYGGFIDKLPMGAAFAKGLTFKMGQTHVPRYMPRLLERIEKGEIDPSFVITHRMHLEDAPEGYGLFRDKKDGCIKIVLEV